MIKYYYCYSQSLKFIFFEFTLVEGKLFENLKNDTNAICTNCELKLVYF